MGHVTTLRRKYIHSSTLFTAIVRADSLIFHIFRRDLLAYPHTFPRSFPPATIRADCVCLHFQRHPSWPRLRLYSTTQLWRICKDEEKKKPTYERKFFAAQLSRPSRTVTGGQLLELAQNE